MSAGFGHRLAQVGDDEVGCVRCGGSLFEPCPAADGGPVVPVAGFVRAPECQVRCQYAIDVDMADEGASCSGSCVYEARVGIDFEASTCPVCDGSHSHDHTAEEYAAALGSFEGYTPMSQEHDGR